MRLLLVLAVTLALLLDKMQEQAAVSHLSLVRLLLKIHQGQVLIR